MLDRLATSLQYDSNQCIVTHMNTCFREECSQPAKVKFCSKSCATTYNNKNLKRNKLKGRCGYCDIRITASRKFCSSEHYAAWRAKQNDGMRFGKTKRCSSCKEVRDYSEFGVNRTTRDGLMRQCKDCNNSRVNSYNKNRTTPVIKNPQWRKHGLTQEEYELLSNVCEACGDNSNLVIDHDHSCCRGTYSCGKCVRGILCGRCNTALGLLKESLDTMKSLMLYLEK